MGLYNSVGRKKKNASLPVAIVLGAVLLILLVFIIWCSVNFSGDAYKNTTQEVSEMKIMLAEKDAEISMLKEQIVKLEELNKRLEGMAESNTPVTVEPSPEPTAAPEIETEDE